MTMQQRPFGASGLMLPVIGLGTWEMEYDEDPAPAIHRAIELGMTHIDTAEMYGNGRVETLLGKALCGRRSEVFLTSKVLPFNASVNGTIQACETSLKALGTDYLDLYLLHWPGQFPVEETLSAFARLQADGKIAAYGVSNFDADELREVVSAAGAGNIACNQVLYHPGERAFEHQLLGTSEELGVPIVAYSPFGHDEMLPPNSPGGRVIAEIAAERQVSIHQVALCFVVRYQHVFTIPKSSNRAHIEDNAAAGEWSLTAAEEARLEHACPLPATGPGMPML